MYFYHNKIFIIMTYIFFIEIFLIITIILSNNENIILFTSNIIRLWHFVIFAEDDNLIIFDVNKIIVSFPYKRISSCKISMKLFYEREISDVIVSFIS